MSKPAVVAPQRSLDRERGVTRMLYGSFPDSIYKPRVLKADGARCDSILEPKPAGHTTAVVGWSVRCVLKGRRAISVRLCMACARAYGLVAS